jgi:tetratricopeptide (TPR) repeat protein
MSMTQDEVADFPENSRSQRMNKILVAIVLGCAVVAAAQGAAQAQAQPAAPQPQAQPQAQPGAPQQKKEIKDPAEYNAYVGAVQQQDPTAKISGLEAFLTQYPNSVMKEDALEILMGTYQQKGDVAKMGDAAKRLLAVNPNNVRALALSTFVATQTQNFADAKQNGEKGLAALSSFNKPDNMSEADFNTLKQQLAGIFHRGVGLASLNDKDFATAATHLHAAVESAPNDVTVVYPLSSAYLKQNPIDYVNGLWFTARAANLAPTPQGQQQIEKYGASQYRKYHGSDQGWSELMAQTKSTPFPPAGFTITQYVPPTPAEQAADIVKTKKVEEMSFAEWELVLSEGKPEDVDKVWSVLKGKPLQMVAQVLEIASPTNLKLAGSSDDIEAKRADIDLTMTAAIPARLMPKKDADFQFEGTPVSYEPKPFVMTMKDGAILTAKAPAGAKKPPARKKTAQ